MLFAIVTRAAKSLASSCQLPAGSRCMSITTSNTASRIYARFLLPARVPDQTNVEDCSIVLNIKLSVFLLSFTPDMPFASAVIHNL